MPGDGFWEAGRDYESIDQNHKYTPDEVERLATHDSLGYFAEASPAYVQSLRQNAQRVSMKDRWMMMGVIGVATGFTGFLLHQTIDFIAKGKWDLARPLVEKGEVGAAWITLLVYSCAFAAASASFVVFVQPAAAGSGMPEVIAYLNGTELRRIFRIDTLAVKFLSCACAVGGGLPVGPEGPMIHLGALIGAGLSQMRSKTLGFSTSFFTRFRTQRFKRDFISAGAAAGVSSAFGAPVGGLLFSLEECSSFWDQRLGWLIFACAMLSATTTSLFNSSFDAFKYEGPFGVFSGSASVLFEVEEVAPTYILEFIPAALVGMLGGALGAVFTFFNLKLSKWRARVVNPHRLRRIAEPVCIVALYVTLTAFVPAGFACRSDEPSDDRVEIESDVQRYTCDDGEYNELATLLWTTGDGTIEHLFSRSTHHEFGYGALVTALLIYFPLACWSAGTAISSGIVVPMLLTGALYGRICGLIMVDIFGVYTGTAFHAWMDPGVFAFIGAAGFFAGVSRLTMSLTVILLEISGDVHLLLPVMTSVICAKWVADSATHSLYHALIELKCYPFLDQMPPSPVSLELFTAKDVAVAPAVSLEARERVVRLAEVLMTTTHNGFPVVQDGRFVGTISARAVIAALDCSQLRHASGADAPTYRLRYEDIHTTSDYSHWHASERLASLLEDLAHTNRAQHEDEVIDLTPYVNTSAEIVQDSFSLERTYILFRTMGLQRLVVVDNTHAVVGIITRKDLMGFRIDERLEHRYAEFGFRLEDKHGHGHGHGGGHELSERLL